ncbi:MAG: hypothetical protein FWE85_03835 [Clostridiales bacterium]|nr:hypothetical protein [Clostridiales bacterium]
MPKNRETSGRARALRYALVVAAATFAVAVLLSTGSQFFLTSLRLWYLAFFLLFVVITIGIFFDIIAVAITVADPAPFHSRASRRLPGASQALALIRNPEKSVVFCSDIVGDIIGTLSGGIGAAIIFSLPFVMEEGVSWLPTAVMAGLVAALTVGGKAACKKFAIKESDRIVFAAGRFLAAVERLFPFAFKKKKNKKSKR